MRTPSRGGPASTEQTLTDTGVRRRVALEPGDHIGRYRIERPLGSGGMGTVYAASDPDLGRDVAIKVLHERRGTEGAQLLLREAQAMAQFSHPNVVTVYDVGTHAGRVFMAMDWVRGPTLRSWMKGRPASAVLHAFHQAGEGLAAVHAAGLVHRDFKPANVMLHPGGRVVVMDFGLARPLADAPAPSGPLVADRTHDDALSPGGSVQGTPAYMAPEQHLAFEVDARADQFSFCVSLFEGLYGKRPFRARTVTELLMRVSNREFVDIPRTRVPKRIYEALVRGLAERAVDRWPSMDMLLDRLDPSARSTWTVAGVGVAAVAILGLAGMTPDDPCSARGDAVRALWTSSRRDAVRSRIAASAEPYAPRMAREVTGTLDEYVALLADTHDQACATEIDATLLDRRTACLDHRFGALRAALSVLDTRSGSKPEQASSVVGDLPAPTACLDTEALARAGELPADGAHRIQVGRTKDVISEAQALEVVGEIRAAHERAKEALVLARECHYPPVEAEALLVYASSQEAQGEYAAAADTFEAAYHLARAHRHDVGALRAAVELVYVVGYRLQQAHAVDAWVRRAETILPHVAAEDAARYETRLASNEATLAYSAGDYEAAVQGFRRTAQLRTARHGDGHEDVAAAHSNLGLALTRRGELDEALDHHERARSAWEASLGPKHPMVAVSIHNRAYVLEEMGRLDLAAQEYEHAIALREEILEPNHPSVALSINNLGNVRRRQDRCLDALTLHQQALAIWLDAYGPEHRRVAEAYSGMSEALLCQDRLEEARLYAERALSTLQATVGAAHIDYARALLSLGTVAAAEDDLDGATASLLRARTLVEDTAGVAHPLLTTIERELEGLGP